MISQIATISKNIELRLSEDIIGQKNLITLLIISVFSGGHGLIEGSPWLGKTRAIKALSGIFDLKNTRISFTPDLIPSDIIGSEIYKMKTETFEIVRGPIFTNILLADEINRTPPKVQSALLEAMEEKRVTISNHTFDLPQPFFVFATQNSLENTGTYPLPEAQLDRFFIKIPLSHPSKNDEIAILKNLWKSSQKTPLLNGGDLITISNFIDKTILVSNEIYDYVARFLNYFRSLTQWEHALLNFGPSSRAGIWLIRWAKSLAAMNGREYIHPDDIKFLLPYVFWHRLGLSFFAMTENISIETIIKQALENVEIIAD